MSYILNQALGNPVTVTLNTGAGSTVAQQSFPWLLPRHIATYNFQHDALVNSCAVHRLRRDHGLNLGLTDNSIYDLITPEDHAHADNIRIFYSKKLVLLQLQHNQVSKFRSDLAKFISDPGLEVDSDTLGLVYRLPEFYAYDTGLSSMIETVFAGKITRKIAQEFGKTKQVYQMTPVNKLFRGRRGTKSWQYWFYINPGRYPAMISVQHDNPLIGLWDSLFNTNICLNVNAKMDINNIDGFKFFYANRWELQNTVTLV